MEKQGVNDHMDALLLLLDEIVDGGCVIIITITCTIKPAIVIKTPL